MERIGIIEIDKQEKKVLSDSGKISHKLSVEKAESEYEKYKYCKFNLRGTFYENSSYKRFVRNGSLLARGINICVERVGSAGFSCALGRLKY